MESFRRFSKRGGGRRRNLGRQGLRWVVPTFLPVPLHPSQTDLGVGRDSVRSLVLTPSEGDPVWSVNRVNLDGRSVCSTGLGPFQ